jgi:hypothetical protein
LRAVFDAVFSFTRIVWKGHRLRWEVPTLTTVQRYLYACPDEAVWEKANFARLLQARDERGKFLWPTMVPG